MRLLIIRHGESKADILNVHEGRADFELTERGHAQAEAMSEYVNQNYSLSKIYHSTLKRAVQTAGHLSRKTGAPPIPDEHLTEFNNDLPIDLTYSGSPSLHSPGCFSESRLDFRYRAEYNLSKVISENDDKSTIAVVTHGGMINQLYCAFFRLPVDSEYAFWTGYTSIHEWIISGNSRTVVRANFLPHNI
ncbi:MAG: histidine phosphatase family protein [Oscillospiraceae bacterium]|nr:histidine phosphatase family protein [Oscillospiraceae bacterium]